MDGKLLLRQLRDLMNEADSSGWVDDFTSYQYLWQAATEFTSRTECFRSTQSILTIVNTPTYRLNADYLQLYAKDKSNRHFVKLSDGTSDHYLFYKDYTDILYETSQDPVEFPYSFSIIDDPNPPTTTTRVTTLAGTSSGGQCTLTDALAAFGDIDAGDTVHNVTDGSMGIVLSKTSSTALVTALFDGTNNDWSVGDTYVIVPQGRYLMVVDPEPSVSAYTITLPYVQRPAPVFSDYGSYKLQNEYSLALLMYATWLYKYRDSQPNVGDRYYQHFDNQVKRYSYSVSNRIRPNSRMKVNMKARA